MKNILGIGNALVDSLTLIPDDSVLKQLQLPKGGMQHVDAETSLRYGAILNQYGSTMAAGGSTANTMSGAARLGVQTGYIGKVGRDERGRFFENEMVKTHVKPMLLTTDTPTGCAEAIVSKNGERTFATYLGAALELSPDDITPEQFDGWDILYVEGYLVSNRPLLDKVFSIAKEKGMKVALDMASYNIVRENRDYMRHFLKEYVDVIFANEDEALTFTLLNDPLDALKELATLCETAVVKVGAKGAYMKRGNDTGYVSARKANVIDTTGAGDLWAAGFMSGYVKDLDINTCARIGSVLAANVIEVLGAKMDEKRWEKIQNELKEL